MPGMQTGEVDVAPSTLKVAVWAGGIVGIAAIGAVDYASGTELRVYPLYYGPVGLLAWYAGRAGAISAALLAAISWLCFNYLAGMRFTSDALWAANAAVHGTAFLFVGLLIASLRGALARASELSRTDPLTLLRNSRAFYEDTAPLLALCRRTRRPVTLAYIDLDNFKTINDTHGHEAGDALLRRVAVIIRSALRPSDLCARLGGDEFAVLLPELGEEQASATLERLRAAVSTAAEHATGVTASIGGVTFLTAPKDLETLVRHADRLMYDAKASGRNRIVRECAGSPDKAERGLPPASSEPAG